MTAQAKLTPADLEMECEIVCLVRNPDDVESALAAVRGVSEDRYSLLGIRDEAPFLVASRENLKGVSPWSRFGVEDPAFSRFWMNRYRAIEEIVRGEMESAERVLPESAFSANFIFDLVWLAGSGWYDAIVTLDLVFGRSRPRLVYHGLPPGPLFGILAGFARRYSFELTSFKMTP